MKTSLLFCSTTYDLLSWFEKEGVVYPWSKTKDPYAIWISEIMLQQTVVGTVTPFYERWMSRFPSLTLLVEADQQEVLRLWEGLGYYSRARHIHKTAEIVWKKWGGIFPAEKKALLALPGIGPYTASAILSLAFRQSEPLLDTNVKRIFQRFFCEKSWNKPLEGMVTEGLKKILKQQEDPGRLNCALIQLGQRLCSPNNPACDRCPLSKECRAYRHGKQKEIPPKKVRALSTLESFVPVLIKKNSLLMVQPKKGIGRGLFFFPRIALTDKANFLASLDSPIKHSYPLSSRTHHYTRYKEHLHPLALWIENFVDPKQKNATPSWILRHHLPHIPVPTVYRAITEELLQYINTAPFSYSEGKS